MKNLKYLIGGNPGGGTSFTASYLTACGLPTGHECIDYKIDPSEWVWLGEENMQAVSSYTTIEYCRYAPLDILPVILIIRNPYDVLNSMVAKRVRTHQPVDINSAMNEIITRYQDYRALGSRIGFVCYLERNLGELLSFLSLDQPKIDTFFKSRHHNHGTINLRRDDIKHHHSFERFESFCKEHLYEPA